MTLRETIERAAKRFAKGDVPPNEETAKRQIIEPILEDLGWDVSNHSDTKEVEFERVVGRGKKKGRVDIALMKVGRGSSECVCLVEAKAPLENLENHVDQLLDYSFRENADVCVLTNAEDWWLYLPREKGGHNGFAKINLKNEPEQAASELEQFLGKEAILSGESEGRAKKRLAALKDAGALQAAFPDVWHEMINEPDPDLVELLSRRISESIGLRPSRDQIAKLLSGEEVSHVTADQPDVQATPDKAKKTTRRTAKSSKSPKIYSAKPSYITLWENRIDVASYTNLLVEVVKALDEKYPGTLVERVSQNWKPTVDVPISSERPHSAKNARYFYKNPDWPCWIQTNANAITLIWRVRQILIAAGNAASDLRIFDQDGEELDVQGHHVLPIKT